MIEIPLQEYRDLLAKATKLELIKADIARRIESPDYCFSTIDEDYILRLIGYDCDKIHEQLRGKVRSDKKEE